MLPDHYDPRRDSTPHPCNDPSLGPLEFLYAVMRDTTFPMSVRIDAAAKLLPFTESVPRPAKSVPRCTIVIGGLGPLDKSPSPEGTEQINTETQSFSSDRQGNSHPPHGHPGPSNLTTTLEPDYSHPPSPSDLLQIKAVVDRLRPDLAHLPAPEFHLCPCGHWITGTYPCCEALRASRDPSKMN